MATATDAELILKLYELRTEGLLRKARHFMAIEFHPKTLEELLEVTRGFGTEKNAYWRQVTSYWEMAASFVLHGTLNRDLFLEPSFSGEMFVIYGKIEPFLKELREKMQSPTIFGNVEKVIATSEGAPERLKQTQERLAKLRQAAQSNKAA